MARSGNTQRTAASPENPRVLADLLRRCRKSENLTSDILAVRLGKTAVAVRAQIVRPAAEWRIGTLREYCDSLNCPIEWALEAAVQELGYKAPALPKNWDTARQP